MLSSESAGCALASAEPHAPLLHEAVILTKKQVLLHLSHGIERHTYNDQK
jgi:hypothetical protein